MFVNLNLYNIILMRLLGNNETKLFQLNLYYDWMQFPIYPPCQRCGNWGIRIKWFVGLLYLCVCHIYQHWKRVLVANAIHNTSSTQTQKCLYYFRVDLRALFVWLLHFLFFFVSKRNCQLFSEIINWRYPISSSIHSTVCIVYTFV